MENFNLIDQILLGLAIAPLIIHWVLLITTDLFHCAVSYVTDGKNKPWCYSGMLTNWYRNRPLNSSLGHSSWNSATWPVSIIISFAYILGFVILGGFVEAGAGTFIFISIITVILVVGILKLARFVYRVSTKLTSHMNDTSKHN